MSGLANYVSGAMEFNKATLSGALDVIVIQRSDGSMHSTPFNIRFGKDKLIKCNSKRVEMRVNGRVAPIEMYLGPEGQAYFLRPEEPVEPQSAHRSESLLELPTTQRSSSVCSAYPHLPPEELKKPSLFSRVFESLTRGGKLDPLASALIRTRHCKGTIELSFCGQGNESEFFSHFVSPELFKQRTSELLQDPNLLLKINQNFYNWESSRPLIKEQLRQIRRNKFTHLSTSQLLELDLQPNCNSVEYTVPGFGGAKTITACIYLWTEADKLVISDIDGTITKSDVMGHLLNFIGRDYTHNDVDTLYTAIAAQGYKLVYVSSRNIGLAGSTKKFLSVTRRNGSALPEGPVIMSPDRLLTSLFRELYRTSNLLKQSLLLDIQSAFPQGINPFHAGFGNRAADEISYKSADIDSSKIFTINPTGLITTAQGETIEGYTALLARLDEVFPFI